MNIDLKGLPIGKWRDLKPTELDEIYKQLEGSSSEAPKSHSVGASLANPAGSKKFSGVQKKG